jgi:intracellular sulfur oxidation DsrE/DsrF family protein
MFSRKEFMATTVIAASMTAVAGAAVRDDMPLNFDRERFDQILHRAAYRRMCFSTRFPADGEILFLMKNFLDAYDASATTAKHAQAVGVLYHGVSFIMALDQPFWSNVLAPFVRKGGVERERLYSKLEHNDCLDDPSRDGATIDGLAARGCDFFICYNAFTNGVLGFAEALGVSPSSLYQQALAALVPSAMIVPAGVMAICETQAAGFAYMPVTV